MFVSSQRRLLIPSDTNLSFPNEAIDAGEHQERPNKVLVRREV